MLAHEKDTADDFQSLNGPRRFLLATDTWLPTTNGVVDSLAELRKELTRRGHKAEIIGPQKTLPNPVYPDIPIPLPRTDVRALTRFIEDFAPHHIHIASEVTVGLQVRGLCKRLGYEFTTSFHTMWPHYMKAYMRMPEMITWAHLRRFHNAGSCTMTRSRSLAEELLSRGFHRVAEWNGNYDSELFHERPRRNTELKRPILLYVGRVAREKNIEEFLGCEDFGGTKVVVGDGPHRTRLEKQFPGTVFTGQLRGEALGQWFCEGDVFVFPSRTDTFGRVIVQALASGVPVAAFPVTGPRDIITLPELGALSEDLSSAISQALERGVPERCIEHARSYSLESTTDQFIKNVVPATDGHDPSAKAK